MKTQMNENSLLAHAPEKRKPQKERVYSMIEVMRGITQPEIAKILGLSRQTVSGRCNDLKKDGRIVADGIHKIDGISYECYRVATSTDVIEVKQKPIDRLIAELKILSLSSFIGYVDVNSLNKIIQNYE